MKKLWPLEDARDVAEWLVWQLAPVCERIEIAGSSRRKKEHVGDVELLYVPSVLSQPDLFGNPNGKGVNKTDEVIARLLSMGQLEKRKNVKGSEVWGASNKLAVHVASGIPVDLFSTSMECWANALVVRTGGKSTNQRIASLARGRGWQWNVYGPGFSKIHGGEVEKVETERDVFRFVGLNYQEPEARI